MSLNMAPIVTSGLNYSTHPSSPTSTPSSLTPTSMEDPLLKKDDESEPTSPSNDTPKKAGRRKIKIEFIDDKSRRHITFSKRKAGIMKKAYELSTLTGTQVLLLVASETGHVYTFATSKLQPLITRPEGKNLIQSCLNTPDAPTSPPLLSASTNNQSGAGSVSLQVATTPPRMGQSSISAQQANQQQQQQAQQQHHQQAQQQQQQMQQVQQQVQHQQQQQQQLQQQYADSLMMAAYTDSLYGSNNEQDKEVDRRSSGMGGMSKDQKGYLSSQNMDIIGGGGYGSGYQNSHIINTMGGGYYNPAAMSNNRGYSLGNGSASSSPASPTQYTYPHSMIGQYPSQ